MLYLLLAIIVVFTLGFLLFMSFSKKKPKDVEGGENILPDKRGFSGD